MLNRVKSNVFSQLWQIYTTGLIELSTIECHIQQHFQEELKLDHLAIIDLPGPCTGMDTLSCLFSYLDYTVRGQDYLAEKQNNFRWLSEAVSPVTLVVDALPQIVVADFRREALAPEVLSIVDYYAAFAQPLDSDHLKFLQRRTLQQDEHAADEMSTFIMHYLQQRDWPLPTMKEYEIVKSHNELLAWVLVMGRQVNHFAWAIHLSKGFTSLEAFNHCLLSSLSIPLNEKGGLIKGNVNKGIEQSATQPVVKSVKLADGYIELSDRFIEPVSRYSHEKFWPSCPQN
jgi:hypothetical protein